MIGIRNRFTRESEEACDARQNVDSKQRVPLSVAKHLFGEDPEAIMEEWNEVLVA